MNGQAILFGAIGTLVETSDMQRRAFNLAFVAEGLDWYWDARTYAEMLQTAGGAARIADFAESLGESVDADAVHETKVALFAEMIKRNGLQLRPGVKETIEAAKRSGVPVGFVTATGQAQVDAIFAALGDQLSRDDFAYIGDASQVNRSKPAPDIYLAALQSLGVDASEAIAIEDSVPSANSAIAAGIMTYVTPGQMHRGAAFPAEAIVIQRPGFDLLGQQRIAAE